MRFLLLVSMTSFFSDRLKMKEGDSLIQMSLDPLLRFQIEMFATGNVSLNEAKITKQRCHTCMLFLKSRCREVCFLKPKKFVSVGSE